MERELILKLNTGTIYAQLARSRKILVQGVEIMLHAGESLALIGETGSGKTMTARSVMRLLPSNVKHIRSPSCFTLDGSKKENGYATGAKNCQRARN